MLLLFVLYAGYTDSDYCRKNTQQAGAGYAMLAT